MVICLSEEFHSPLLHQAPETLQDIGTVLPQLLNERAGYTERNLKPPFKFIYKFLQNAVGRNITFIGNFVYDAPVELIIKIVMRFTYMESSVGTQSIRLMHLKVKNDMKHFISLLSLYIHPLFSWPSLPTGTSLLPQRFSWRPLSVFRAC